MRVRVRVYACTHAAGDAQAAERMLSVMTREHKIPPDARCFMVRVYACTHAPGIVLAFAGGR